MNENQVKINLQIGLNRRMYKSGKISYAMYSQANEILITRLAACEKSEKVQEVKAQSSASMSATS